MKILWIDDDREFAERISGLVLKSHCEVEFEFAESYGEAEQMVSELELDGAIFDMRLGEADYNESEDGSKLLLEVGQAERTLPTFAYSAFLDEVRYRNNLDESYVMLEGSKTLPLKYQLSPSGFFNHVIFNSEAYSEAKSFTPELIEFATYQKNPEKFEKELQMHWRKHRGWVEGEMRKRGATWIVVAGTSVVDCNENPDLFPDFEKLMRIGEEKGLIPFAYSAEHRPESIDPVGWSATTSGDDYYPQISLDVGEPLVADFDTGAYRTHMSDEYAPSKLFQFPRALLGNKNSHLGVDYEKFTQTIEMSLPGNCGNTKSAKVPVEFVKEWAESPFVNVNPKRRALAGRDILRIFETEVTLNGSRRTTYVNNKGGNDD